MARTEWERAVDAQLHYLKNQQGQGIALLDTLIEFLGAESAEERHSILVQYRAKREAGILE